MNEPRDRRAKLVAELFHENWAGGPVSDFARIAAAHARRRRRLRQSLVAASAVTGFAALIAVALFHRPPVAPIAVPPRAAPAYEIISDDELLAHLRDRPLLVLRKENGGREFVVLGD